MPTHLPLLIFPKYESVSPPSGRPVPPRDTHFPNHEDQKERLGPKIEKLKASISQNVAGLEPETVLIIEIVGSVEQFYQAVEKVGLEWLGERDVEEIEPDEYFYQYKKSEQPEEKIKADQKLKGRIFLSFLNQQGLKSLLSLWTKWKNKEKFSKGETKWRDVFKQTKDIRQWSIQEALIETGMINRWQDIIDPIEPDKPTTFQIELFYRKDPKKRKQNEKDIEKLLKNIGGKTISAFIDMEDIAFHAVKAQLPAQKISDLVKQIKSNKQSTLDIHLFKFPNIMYFRPTGQSISSDKIKDITGEQVKFPKEKPTLPPVGAILDGVPIIKHSALNNRILLDDPDNLSSEYQPGEQKHGTSMASLIIHGDLSDKKNKSLTSQVYHLPIMQLNPKARSMGKVEEHFPDHIFFEDRIERAVRRMFEGEGNIPAQAPTVKIINLSICDPERPFIHTPSPLARLLDYLSFKYCVLFCVSAGNFKDNINLGVLGQKFIRLTTVEKQKLVLKSFKNQLHKRRLLSPAESLNSLTVGALHADQSKDYQQGNRVDLLPESSPFFSPISRFGHGFRRSIKPEILLPGGRQLYSPVPQRNTTDYHIASGNREPGQKVAWDSKQAGESSNTVWTNGTSNATALATRSGVQIYEMLSALQKKEKGNPIPENLMAVLIKTLLVHSAKQDKDVVDLLTQNIENSGSRKRKEVLSRYMGYGNAHIDRVLQCTEQRGTVIGFGEINTNKAHAYYFPLPISLSGKEISRQMLVTLAWFSPINPRHRNLREAKLELKPYELWDKTPLRLQRKDSDHRQVLRGTVQHEVFEQKNSSTSAYEEDGYILLQVTCKADATDSLDGKIPYGLAVTLEVEDSIPIYSEIRQKLKLPVQIKT